EDGSCKEEGARKEEAACTQERAGAREAGEIRKASEGRKAGEEKIASSPCFPPHQASPADRGREASRRQCAAPLRGERELRSLPRAKRSSRGSGRQTGFVTRPSLSPRVREGNNPASDLQFSSPSRMSTPTLRLALAQLNFFVGDVAGNTQRVLD